MKKPFKLIPSYTSPSEQDFVKVVGESRWQEIKHREYNNSSPVCTGCGYTVQRSTQLQIHLNWWDGTNPETAEFYLVCEGCHTLKHFDKAAELDWAVLCNSVYTQEELMLMNRSGGKIRYAMDNHKIVLLKRTAEQYLAELKESELNRNEKIKIIFGNKFTWKK